MPAPTKAAPLSYPPTGLRVYTMPFGQYPEVQAGATLTGTPTLTQSVTNAPAGVTAAPLTLGTPTIVGTGVQFSITGGTDGCDYNVQVSVSLSGGGGGPLVEDAPYLVRN